MRRTRTFVSTAHMPLPRVAPDTRLELLERLPLGGARGEDRPMDILGGVAPRPADDNGAAVGPRTSARVSSSSRRARASVRADTLKNATQIAIHATSPGTPRSTAIWSGVLCRWLVERRSASGPAHTG